VPRYRDDIRYLRLWVQYADCLPDPTDVFKFLKENEVGQSHALFYIAYATFLELRGSYSAADNVFQQGLNRLAAPQDRLKAKFDEFQHRMARRIQRKAQEQSSIAVEDPGHPERQSLAVLGGRRSVRSAGLASQKRKAIATPGRGNAPAGSSGNGGLDIFVDEEFGGSVAHGGSASTSAAADVGGGAHSSAWTSLPSYEQIRKENTQKATSWAGQRMKQTKAFAAPPAPALSIPLDPEFEEAEKNNTSRAAAAAEARNQQVSIRQRLDRGGLDEQLAHDPLHLHRHAPVVQAAAAVPIKAAREEILSCNKDALQGDDGDERSFEEVRAKAWIATKKLSAQDMDMEEVEEVPPPSPIPTSSLPTGATTVRVDAEAPKATPFDQPKSKHGETSVNNNRANTAAVSTGPVPGVDTLLSSDMTMNTKDAFDAINAAFGGMFGGDAPVLADSEPTMTISTKEAFAAINTMFAKKVRCCFMQSVTLLFYFLKPIELILFNFLFYRAPLSTLLAMLL
jgi:checkpoint serine/threonine-protein kinase